MTLENLRTIVVALAVYLIVLASVSRVAVAEEPVAEFGSTKTVPTLQRDLALPPIVDGPPTAGKRVAVSPPEYAGSDVHHMLYLPDDWTGETDALLLPVIVEYAGNHFPTSGSTGEVEGAQLGFGISQGKFIWVSLPFISKDHKSNALRWWGDEEATIEYAKTNVRRICKQFGGDPNKVLLCGFSRGAIATNYIGLHDDEIAKLWCGFITHDHFDGVREWKGTTWGTPLEQYRREAATRLSRLAGRPYLVCQAGSTQVISDYLRPITSLDNFTFLDVPVETILGELPNEIAVHPHTDRWMVVESPQRRVVHKWVADVLATKVVTR